MPEFISTLLPGLSGMPNIHPMVVHFPVALLSAFLLTEIAAIASGSERLRFAATWMLCLGATGAVAAVVAGMHAAATVEHGEEVHAIIERHAAFGMTVAALSVVLSVVRIYVLRRPGAYVRAAYVLASVVMVAVMMLGADRGGLMVYTHGVGVAGQGGAGGMSGEAAGHAHDHEHHQHR